MTTNTSFLQNIVNVVRSPQGESLDAKVSLFAFVIQLVVLVINKTLLKNHEVESLIFSEIGAIVFLEFLDLLD